MNIYCWIIVGIKRSWENDKGSWLGSPWHSSDRYAPWHRWCPDIYVSESAIIRYLGIMKMVLVGSFLGVRLLVMSKVKFWQTAWTLTLSGFMNFSLCDTYLPYVFIGLFIPCSVNSNDNVFSRVWIELWAFKVRILFFYVKRNPSQIKLNQLSFGYYLSLSSFHTLNFLLVW